MPRPSLCIALILTMTSTCGCGSPTATSRFAGPAASTSTRPSTSTPASAWWRGGVDCHVHVAPDAEDGAAVIEMLDDAGLERACLLSPGYQRACDAAPCDAQRAQTTARNDWTLAEAARSERLVPFCGIPIGGEWACDEMRRCLALGAVGVKVHPVNQQLSLTDATVAEQLGALFEVAGSAGAPVLVHVAFEPAEIRALYELARAHPDTTIIVAHQLGPQVAMLLEAPDNVGTDLSGLSMITAEQAESLLPIWRQVGFERILFGSDWPHLEPSAHLDLLDALPLTGDERAAVSRGAFERATTATTAARSWRNHLRVGPDLPDD